MTESNDSKKKKVPVFVKWICIFLILILNVGISLNLGDNGGCISVTFDKLPMLLVNRAVICVGENRYEFSDIELVRDIVHQTTVATNTDLCCSATSDRWLELYCGNFLVRRMQWEENHDGIVVYKAGLFHWIIFSMDGNGLVYPTDELLNRLEAIINTSVTD